MSVLGLIPDVIGAVGNLVDDLVTTDEERSKMALEDKKIDAGLLQGQIDTNRAEAGHASVFVAGWRPYVGWVAGTALGMVYIPKALVLTGIWTYQAIVVVSAWKGTGPVPVLPEYPDLGVTDLLGLLGSLLGFGAMRTAEAFKSVKRDTLGAPKAK